MTSNLVPQAKYQCKSNLILDKFRKRTAQSVLFCSLRPVTRGKLPVENGVWVLRFDRFSSDTNDMAAKALASLSISTKQMCDDFNVHAKQSRDLG
jgi:hypothetical protein